MKKSSIMGNRAFHRKARTWILICMILPGHVSWCEIPEVVVDAAQDGLPGLFGSIQEQQLEMYGFPQESKLVDLVLGTPFQLHTIPPSNLLDKAESTPVRELITKTSMWYFPVLVADKPCALLCVDRVNTDWKAVSLGYSNLARQVDAIRGQWPESQGYHPVIIAVFQARQHLFTIPEYGTENLTHISAPEVPSHVPGKGMQAAAAAADYNSLTHSSNIIMALRPMVQANLTSEE